MSDKVLCVRVILIVTPSLTLNQHKANRGKYHPRRLEKTARIMQCSIGNHPVS